MIYLSKSLSTELDGNKVVTKDVWAIKTDFGTIELSCDAGHFDETDLYVSLGEIKEQFGTQRRGQRHDLYRPYTLKGIPEEESIKMEQEWKVYLRQRIESQIKMLQRIQENFE